MDESEIGLQLLNTFTSIFVSPFDYNAITGLIIILILLFFSAMVSGSEIAFFSLTPQDIDDLKGKEDQKSLSIQNHIDNPKELLAIILISNNFINVAIVVLSAWTSNLLFDFSNSPTLGFLIQVITITAFILLFGEIMPKIYARQKAFFFINIMSSPLHFMKKIFKPLMLLLVHSTNVIDKRLQKSTNEISMSELSEAVELTHNQDEEKDEENAKILKSITTYGEIEVKEIMIARVNVDGLDINTSWKQVKENIRDWGYSRIPVFEESFDTIKGILYIKDLLAHLEDDNFEWQSVIREAFYVPENKKINALLQEIKQKKIHLAIVVDEYGGTSGIVTLEDVLEEVVGEISDEFDEKETDLYLKVVGENCWLFDAKTSIKDLCKVLDISPNFFDLVKGESDSIAGLILELLGDFPKINQKIIFKNIEFEVIMMDNRRIKRVNVKRLPNE